MGRSAWVFFATLLWILQCGVESEASLDDGLFEALLLAPEPRQFAGWETASFAALRNVSLMEAEERLGRHAAAADFSAAVAAQLGGAFGGAWISADDRIQVALAEFPFQSAAALSSLQIARHQASVMEIAERLDLETSVDLHLVRRSMQELESTNAVIANELLQTGLPLSAAIQPEFNRVIVRSPANRVLTAREQAALEEFRLHGDRVYFGTYVAPDKTRECISPYCYPAAPFAYPHINPPLRGGAILLKNGSWPACTGGFIARSKVDNYKYIITAGHCIDNVGQYWASNHQNGDTYGIGHAHNFIDGDSDMGIIRVFWDGTLPAPFNTHNWDPRKWVFVTDSADSTYDPDYAISSVGYSVVGQRVCTTGMATGQTSCGFTTELGYSSGMLGTKNLGVASFCGTAGDSGAPVMAFHVAYGLHVGGSTPCNSYYQGIQAVQENMNVQLVY